MTDPRTAPTKARSLPLSAALFLLVGCATIGDETAFPGPVESGVAPFRVLSMGETGLDDPGRVVPAGGAFDRGMRTQSAFWYAHGSETTTPPDRDPTLAEHEVDWKRFAPRRILRSPSNAPDSYGFDVGTVVFEADAEWQQGAVFDPWAVERGDGQVRLYFAGGDVDGVAGPGGIGVTTGPAGGPFGPSTLVLENARAPSVVEYEGELWLFFERAGRIGLATSTDGSAFEVRSEALELGELSPDDEVASETSQHSPGAVVVTSPVGRTSVRVYFGVRREDRTSALGVSATQDGVAFDRWDGDVFSDAAVNMDNPAQPAPYVEDGATFLYASRAFLRGEQRRLLIGGISPARTMLVPATPDE